tara:strand:- start:178 stop:309 length:132 start_codon:yes stop_codon:yes gene_type:complete
MQLALFIFLSKFLTVSLSIIQMKDFSKVPSALAVVQRLPIFTL